MSDLDELLAPATARSDGEGRVGGGGGRVAGKSTLTARLGASPASIARALVVQMKAVQRDEDDDDPEARLPRAMRRRMREEDHRSGQERRTQVYQGTDIPVADEHGDPVERQTGGGDRAGRTQLGGEESIRGGTRRRQEVRGGVPTDVDEIDEEQRRRGNVRTRRGTQAQQLDGHAMAADLRGQLEHELGEMRRLAQREGRADSAEHHAEVEAYERDIATLNDVRRGDDPAVVQMIARRRHMLVAPQHRVVEGEVTSTERGLDGEAAREGRLRHTDRRTAERVENGTRTVHTDETSHEVDAAEGRYERVVREEDEAEVGGETARRVDERATSAQIDQGIRGARRRTRTRSHTDGDGNEQSRSETGEVNGGVIADEDGWGLTGGGTRRSTVRDGDEERGSETGGSITARENSLAGRGSTEQTARSGNRTFGVKAAADGSFTIDIEAMNSETPPTYRLVFTIHVGVAGSLSVGRSQRDGNGVRGGVGVTGEASGDLVLRRTITAEQAAQYWTEAERAERDPEHRPNQALPEFGRLARIRAGIDNRGQMANATAVAGDADAARDMAPGEETELTLRGEVGGNANVGYRGRGVDVGADARASEELTRRVLISRVGEGENARVRVTVTYARNGEWEVGGRAGVANGPTVAARRGGNRGDGDSVRFTLDPNAPTYESQYQTIVRTTARAELQALAADPAYQQAVDYTEHTEQEGNTAEETVGMGDGPNIGIQRRNHYDERVRRGRDGALSGEANGSQDTSLRVGQGEQTLAAGGTEGSSHAVVERDGEMDVTLQEREHNTNPLRTAREAQEAVEGADGEERARQALGGSPGRRLRQLLSTEYETLRGYHLESDDIEAIAERAADRSRWTDCCASPRVLAAFMRLRGQLRNPPVRRDEHEIDPVVARRLAIARSLARFYQEGGRHAQTSMANVIRNWGAAGFHGVMRDSDEEQLGSAFEWPHELRSQQRRYERLRAEVRDLERAAQGRPTQEDTGELSADQRYQQALHVHEQLTDIYTAVANNDDFENEGARASLLRHIDGFRTTARRLRVEHREQLQAGRRRPAPADRGDGDEPIEAMPGVDAGTVEGDQAAAEGLDRMLQQANTDLAMARSKITSIPRRLRGFKQREQEEFREMRSAGDHEVVARKCGELHDMARIWYREIQDLRDAYERVGTPRGEWVVSERGGRRNREHEPDMNRVIAMYERANSGLARAFQDGTRVAQWRREFAEY